MKKIRGITMRSRVVGSPPRPTAGSAAGYRVRIKWRILFFLIKVVKMSSGEKIKRKERKQNQEMKQIKLTTTVKRCSYSTKR
jgi:hypothetical protein